MGSSVHTVLASRGEPSTPEVPEEGLVWRSIADHWDDVGFENDYITVAELARDGFGKHPWSLAGGGATELKQLLEDRAHERLKDIVDVIGFGAVTREDDVYLVGREVLERHRIPAAYRRRLVAGEDIRDWSVESEKNAIWPYDEDTGEPVTDQEVERFLWPWKARLEGRVAYGRTQLQRGLPWFAYSMYFADRFKTPLTIAFAFVATHNHFVLDRGGKVFNRSAPIIKLPDDATEDDHLALLAYLNSSTASFYFRQVCHSKGAQGVNEGHKSEVWEQFLEYAGSAIEELPLPKEWRALAPWGREMDELARDRLRIQTNEISSWKERKSKDESLLHEMVFIQEELDWIVYELFGLPSIVSESPNRLKLRPGHRAFELGLDAGSSWVARNGYETSPPQGGDWSEEERSRRVERQRLIQKDRLISALERPEHKRRWALVDYHEAAERGHRRQLEQLSEAAFQASATVLTPNGVMAESGLRTNSDRSWQEADILGALDEASVPFLAPMFLSSSGWSKYEQWTAAWVRQAQGDEEFADIPPRFRSVDYSSAQFWSLRGKLNVPHEAFISYPGCESDEDGEPVYGWAGWDHEQRAKALASLYWDRKTSEGWGKDRLIPMLAGLLELQFWLELWHGEPSDDYGGVSPASYYKSFLDGQCQECGLTHDDLRNWRPEPKTRGRRKKKTARKTEEAAE